MRSVVPTWRFVMAGAADYQNPSSISAEILAKYQSEGIIEWLGLVEDMEPLFAAAGIVCLPSYYREGVPKFLLESGRRGMRRCPLRTLPAAERRSLMESRETNSLRDPVALADCIIALIRDRARRERYGIQGRHLAAERFDIRAVVAQINDIYAELMTNANSA